MGSSLGALVAPVCGVLWLVPPAAVFGEGAMALQTVSGSLPPFGGGLGACPLGSAPPPVYPRGVTACSMTIVCVCFLCVGGEWLRYLVSVVGRLCLFM